MQDALDERKELDEQFEITGRNPKGIFIERPISTSPDAHPVNGNYSLPDEDEEEEVEEDLILGDEEDLGDEEEYDIELEEDLDEADMDEDDLVIETDDEEDEEEDDDL